MGTPTCKELCLRVLRECPWEHFCAGDVARVVEVRHGRRFRAGTVARALNELWRDHECEKLVAGTSPPVYARKREDELTDSERAARREWESQWIAHNGSWVEDVGWTYSAVAGLLPEETAVPASGGPGGA